MIKHYYSRKIRFEKENFMSTERRVMLAMQEQPIVLLPFLFFVLLLGRGLDHIARAVSMTRPEPRRL